MTPTLFFYRYYSNQRPQHAAARWWEKSPPPPEKPQRSNGWPPAQAPTKAPADGFTCRAPAIGPAPPTASYRLARRRMYTFLLPGRLARGNPAGQRKPCGKASSVRLGDVADPSAWRQTSAPHGEES
ncbi:hypothetical protein TraAM80_06749 [Trypanosoma rangeli]|uniref:Uncharacterized protein n=1 Tax=Trypanosoma rangeli TaxID=5698 RepID=A0A3R7K5B4_TRYRA|nr:uncharacterized protein TraAM80_06749 [Trypanosoma rangeli]RNF01944.1 hypothetical protein TraAM80_06749 [Trypanosoma rangeli]|eukprot:RNF01944.1 hypothetical protein TraAM80_06749 [Trypanosoma rangeli]